MKSGPFSLPIDGSNNNSVNPLTVRICFQRQVTMQLLDMCTTYAGDCGTASTILERLIVLSQL